MTSPAAGTDDDMDADLIYADDDAAAAGEEEEAAGAEAANPDTTCDDADPGSAHDDVP